MTGLITGAPVPALLAPGSSPHTYDPRPSDMRRLQRSAALIRGSETLDPWASDLSGTRVLGLLALLPDSLHRPLSGHAATASRGDSHVLDPHFWTDPLAVKALLPALADTLCTLHPNACDDYRSNVRGASDRLDALHRTVRETVAPAAGRSVLLAQPFLGFFLDRYGIPVSGVVQPGPGRSPGPRRIEELIARTKRDSVSVILTLPGPPPPGTETIARETGARLVSVPALGTEEAPSGYENFMRSIAQSVASAYYE